MIYSLAPPPPFQLTYSIGVANLNHEDPRSVQGEEKMEAKITSKKESIRDVFVQNII